MAKKSISKRKEECLLEFKTGNFTQRELAERNDLGLGTVSSITKGVEKSLEHAVHSVSHATLATEGLSEQEANTVRKVADEISSDTKMFRSLTKANMVGVAAKLKKHDALDMNAHKAAQDTIDKASITLGVNPRHANTTINNTNAQQNNTPELVVNIG